MLFDSLALETTLPSIIVRFFINLIVLFVLIRLIYYRYTKKEEHFFSFFLLGVIINLLCSLLQTVDIQLGMALGLFAIFAILRFRTVNYSGKEMTYIFTVIGISVINSQANIPPPVIGAIIVNSIILLAAFVLEVFLHKKSLISLLIIYNKPGLLTPNNRSELIQDLSYYTGQKILDVKIRKMDVGKGNAEIEVFYRENTRP